MKNPTGLYLSLLLMGMVALGGCARAARDAGATALVLCDTNGGTLTDELVGIVRATRSHESVLVGAGPRATQALVMASRAAAAIAGRDFVTPDDIKSIAVAVLEHRLSLRPEFEIEGVSIPEVIQQVVQQIAVPR